MTEQPNLALKAVISSMRRKVSLLVSFSMLATCASAAAGQENSLPVFKLTVTPRSLDKTEFDIDGSVRTTASSLSFVLMPWHQFKFDQNGHSIEIKNNTEIQFADHRAVNRVHFVGTTKLQGPKSAAVGEEIYCMNNSLPNPEVNSSGSFYDVRFLLPKGYTALAADRDVIQLNGLEFQIAKFSKPIFEKADSTKIEFCFPEGFQAKQEYLDYIKDQLRADLKQFGKLPFSTIKIGAIRRGGSSEINGNPSGNLILYSRTALGDPVKLNSLSQLGISEDISDGLRKMVIAHELAHLWFGSQYLGKDGWMQEGIPQYIGLVAAIKGESEPRAKAMLSFFEKMAQRGPSGPIPNSKFEEKSPGFERDYYQAPLGLYKLGEQLGHDQLLAFLISVYKENRDPVFDDFDRKFSREFPNYLPLWRKIWKLDLCK
jgi:hypothetical protein